MEPSKCPVCVREEYTMSLEYYSNFIWFHSDVFKWTPEVKRKYVKDLNTIQSLLPIPIKAISPETNTKLLKFGESLGWEKEGEVILNDGSKTLIYSWRK